MAARKSAPTATWRLYWGPTGQTIGQVQAKTAKAARRKAPKPYSRYKGEIGVERMNSGRRVRVVSNPSSASQVGTGEWIPAEAVRFNADGTTTVEMRNGGRRRVPNINAGFYEEETGIFHPIRASADYKRARAGERAPKKRRAAARKRPAAKKRAAAKKRR